MSRFCMSRLHVEGLSNLESVVSMQSSAQEVTMLFKLIAAAKDSWACSLQDARTKSYQLFPGWG